MKRAWSPGSDVELQQRNTRFRPNPFFDPAFDAFSQPPPVSNLQKKRKREAEFEEPEEPLSFPKRFRVNDPV